MKLLNLMEMPYAHYDEDKFAKIVHETVVKHSTSAAEAEEEKNK
jgi:hypothetical protein